MGFFDSDSETNITNIAKDYTFVNDGGSGGTKDGTDGEGGRFNLNLAESRLEGGVQIHATDQGAFKQARTLASESLAANKAVSERSLEFGERTIEDVTDLISRSDQRTAQTVDEAIAQVRQSNDAEATQVVESISKYAFWGLAIFLGVSALGDGA